VSGGAGLCDGHPEAGPVSPLTTVLCPTGIRTFIAALDKVAVVNGISRRKPGWLNAWLHGTIARRVEFLEGVLIDRRAERQFQRRLGLLKWGLLTGLVAGLLLLLAAGHWGQIRHWLSGFIRGDASGNVQASRFLIPDGNTRC
jgi:STE24 endopeptidase